VTDDDAALEEHLGQITPREPVAQPPQHHQGDHVRGVLRGVQHAAAALIELPAAVAAPKAPVALRHAIPQLRSARRATVDAFHPGLPSHLNPARSLPAVAAVGHPSLPWRET
jgi:hypothetical protein